MYSWRFLVQNPIAPIFSPSGQFNVPIKNHVRNVPSWNTPLLTGIIVVRARVVLVRRRKRDGCLCKVSQSESMVRPHLFTQLIMLKKIG